MAPRGSRHDQITVVYEYGGDPARATAALVKLLEKSNAAGGNGGAAAEEVRDAGARSST